MGNPVFYADPSGLDIDGGPKPKQKRTWWQRASTWWQRGSKRNKGTDVFVTKSNGFTIDVEISTRRTLKNRIKSGLVKAVRISQRLLQELSVFSEGAANAIASNNTLGVGRMDPSISYSNSKRKATWVM